MDILQIMSWAVGPAVLLSFIIDILAMSKGFEFFEEKKNFRMWPCTIVSFAAVVIFLVGIFKPELRTILWTVSGVIELVVLAVDVIKVKLWGFLAFLVQLIVSVMFPFTLFLLISTFSIGPEKRR